MARKTCPDCKARVPRDAAECPGCGRRMRPRPAHAATRHGSPLRRRAILTLGALLAAAAVALFVLLVPDSAARTRKRQAAMDTILAGLRDLRPAEEAFYRRVGQYGGWLDHLDTIPGMPREARAGGDLLVHSSADGQAYLAEYAIWDGRVACAVLVRRGPSTASTRVPGNDGWNLRPNAPPRCRKTDPPWLWLHWAGIGYLEAAGGGR